MMGAEAIAPVPTSGSSAFRGNTGLCMRRAVDLLSVRVRISTLLYELVILWYCGFMLLRDCRIEGEQCGESKEREESHLCKFSLLKITTKSKGKETTLNLLPGNPDV